MDLNVFDSVQINLKQKASVNYARSRFAIEEHAATIRRSNGARAKRIENELKGAIMDVLQGSIERSPKGLQVVFADGSKAKY